MSYIIKKESETTSSGVAKRYDVFEKTRFNKTLPNMHTHSYYEILLVNEGELSCKIELEIEKLFAGDVIFVPPFVPHSTFREKEGRMRCTVVKFSPYFLSPEELTNSDVTCLLNSPNYSAPYYVFKSSQGNTEELKERLLRTLKLESDKDLGYETALRGELSCLFVKLLQLCDNDIYQNGIPDIDERQLKQLRAALQYVKENYQYDISMAEVARECEMSYYSFSRFFSQMTKKSFSEYLLDTRLSYAQKILLSEKSSISEVAAACGFEYVSYFIRRFKQKYGVTPLEYRKMYNI